MAERPSELTVTVAESDDADVLADLWVELAADQREYGSHLRPAPNRARIHEAMLQHVVTETALLARRGETIVGFVTFGQESESYEQDATRGIVHNIYVRESDRGEGIGTALLETAEQSLLDRGVDTIGLQAMASNEAGRAFYERNGYDPHRIEFEKRVESDNLTMDDE